jgi:carbon starvation protein
MNSLIIVFISAVLLFLGYRYYGRRLQRYWEVSPHKVTPANSNYDGVDFVPAKSWLVLFGHHFASIAGAGPIIGPVIAASIWGWGPGLVWIIAGGILLGGVHDFCSLMISVRQGGKSLAHIAKETISPRAKIVFSTLVWLALLLVIAVFAAVTAKTFISQPEIVVPTFGLILVAVITGLMIYRWRVNQLLATLFGLGLLSALLFLGHKYPISLPFEGSMTAWIIILMVYAYIASILPVNLLLQPRDYLSSFILFFGLGFGYLGLLLSHPTIKAPAYIGWFSSSGPLWPFMCVIIACGAISGFHGLIAGGTTSKQLSRETHAKAIGYGGMLLESALSILALLSVCAGLYWYGGPQKDLVYPELMKSGNWIVAFGRGYGQIAGRLFGVSFASLFAMIMLNSFVMTTLDTATRINRYITEELFAGSLKLLKNRFLSTFVVIVPAVYLALGSWRLIWPVFGATNQLVATLILLTISLWLIERKARFKYVLIPATFMFFTTTFALIYQGFNFYKSGRFLLGNIASICTVSAVLLSWEAAKKVSSSRGKNV